MHSACVEKSEKVESEEIFLRLNSKNLRILGVFQVVNCRTFASPWGNEDTQTLIDILARYGVKTTFFVVGDWAEKYPESVKALHDAGHEVMSHSYHHDITTVCPLSRSLTMSPPATSGSVLLPA